MKAIWNTQIIAQSNATVLLENNHYFPSDSVNMVLLVSSDNTSICPWKGSAHYYSVIVENNEISDAAWYYPDPTPEALHIKGFIAFWNGIEIIE